MTESAPVTKTASAGVQVDESNLCWVCKAKPISYQPQSCDCAIYCKSCAMKMATGGVCKKVCIIYQIVGFTVVRRWRNIPSVLRDYVVRVLSLILT